MATKINWAMVRCMDGRLNPAIRAHLKKTGFPETHDLISIPGGPKDLIDGETGLFRAISDIAMILHGVTNVLLIQHTDCGAYGGRANCGGTAEADREFHLAEIRTAGKALSCAYPELNVHLLLAHIHDSEDIKIEHVTT